MHNLYPKNYNPEIYPSDVYEIHCSRIFAEAMYKDFVSRGFQIPAHLGTFAPVVDEQGNILEPKFVSYQIPTFGILKVIIDMEQGYKIEKQ
jgi:hypothetical protein